MGTPIYWPDDLGSLPIQYGMQRSLTSDNEIDVTEVESGEPRRRLKYYTTLTKHNITFSFSDAAMQQFVVFYMHALYKGTKAFLAKVPYPNGIRVFRCKFDPATYKDTAETYNRWTVTITMDVRDIAIWDNGAQWLLDLYDGDTDLMIAATNQIHQVTHYTYPTAVRGDMYV